MKNEALKNLAMRAKNRLLNKNIRESYSNASIKVIDNRDEEFYNKVRYVMDNEDTVYNPMKYLMDEDKYLKMDICGRERYLLQTIERYREARDTINRQNGTY